MTTPTKDYSKNTTLFDAIAHSLYKKMTADEKRQFDAYTRSHDLTPDVTLLDAIVIQRTQEKEIADILNSESYSFNYKQALAYHYIGIISVCDDWGFANFETEPVEALWEMVPLTKKKMVHAGKNPNLRAYILIWAIEESVLWQSSLKALMEHWTDEVLSGEFLEQLWNEVAFGEDDDNFPLDAFVQVDMRNYLLGRMKRQIGLETDMPDSWVLRAYGLN